MCSISSIKAFLQLYVSMTKNLDNFYDLILYETGKLVMAKSTVVLTANMETFLSYDVPFFKELKAGL